MKYIKLNKPDFHNYISQSEYVSIMYWVKFDTWNYLMAFKNAVELDFYSNLRILNNNNN